MLVLTMGNASSYAQAHYESRVSLGFKAGGGISRVFFNPGVRQIFKSGAVGGLTFRYIEERHFGLIAELLWQQRGWREDFDGKPYEYERTLNYLQLPVMAHIFFGRRGKFFFNAGPEFGLYMGDNVKKNFNPFDVSSLPDFPVKNRTNSQMTMKVTQKIDYGISAGLGGEFSLTPRQSLQLEARFYYGLGNIFPSARADVFSASNQMSLNVTLGYWFRIK